MTFLWNNTEVQKTLTLLMLIKKKSFHYFSKHLHLPEFLHLFDRYLMSTYYVLSIRIDAGISAVTTQPLASLVADILMGQTNKHRTQQREIKWNGCQIRYKKWLYGNGS